VRYVIAKQGDGTWRAAMELPHGDGTLQAVATGLSKAEATVKAARGMQATGKSPKKSLLAKGLAQAASNPAIRDALKNYGMEAAQAAAASIPGGTLALKALKVAAKYGPAKRLLSKLF
jgi:hypothetical protein